MLGTLGRFDELKASGDSDALMRSGLRHWEKFAVIDAEAAGKTEAVRVLGSDQRCGQTTRSMSKLSCR